MCSRFLRVCAVLGLLSTVAVVAAQPLRICADPDDLPFSNRAGQGFDNQIAAMVARDLRRQPVFVWVRSRRGFLREQFNKDACDVLVGVPQGMKAVTTTVPYYRSGYVFVTRRRDHLQIASFSDSHLDGRRIGLQVLEEDLSPPSVPLIRTGHAAQLVGFDSFGTRAGDVVRAVADNRVGLAVVWGPIAGYFVGADRLPLTLSSVSPAVDASGIPFTYAIAMGVHKRDTALRDALSGAIGRLRPQIERVLAQSHVPMLPLQGGA
jgi:mxaJ protein